MTQLRKWLGYSIGFRLTLGELLVIVLLVVVVNAIWPGVPTWVFFAAGFAVTVSQRIWRDIRAWLHRRRTA